MPSMPVAPDSLPPSSVRKACQILRAVCGHDACALGVVAVHAGVDKATALRLLGVLAQEGFVVRNESTKRYAIGPELQALGAMALARFDPSAIVRPSLLRLADELEDTVVLLVPRGHESLCLATQEGRFPIRANYLPVGGRRLLGLGAGSLALLAWLPAREAQAVLESLAVALRGHPRVTPALVESMAAQSRSQGYALSLDIVIDRVGGVGVPILGHDGRPLGALSVSALSDRITSRLDQIVAALQREAIVCQHIWRKQLQPGTPLAPGQEPSQRR